MMMHHIIMSIYYMCFYDAEMRLRIPKHCLGKWRFGNFIHWLRNSQVLADWLGILNLGILKRLSINTAQHHRLGTSVTDLKKSFNLT